MAAQPEDPAAPSPTSAFFYGTLMSPAVLTRVTSRPASAFKTRPALLKAHRRHHVKFADYPAIFPTEGSVVRGTYVEGLNKSDIWRLDTFEGDQYLRRDVKVRLLKQTDKKGASRWKSKHADDGPDVLPPATSVDAFGPNAPEPKEEDLEKQETECATYIWNRDRQELEDEEWDFAEFVREKLWRWAGASADVEGEYEEVDAAVEHQEHNHDPTGGRAIGGAWEKNVNGQ